MGRRRGTGLSDEDIDRLADDFIAEDRGEATERFIDWAIRVRRAAGPHGLITDEGEVQGCAVDRLASVQARRSR